MQQDHLLATWQANNRVTEFLIENLPAELWDEKIPGAPQKTIRMIAGHIHNARCMWIKMLGRNLKVKPPASVNRRNVNRTTLLHSLKQSNQAMIDLLNVGLSNEGKLNANVPWQNFPADVFHFNAYLISHEAHHRGQIVLVARMLGHRLSPEITNGLWQWKQRIKEVKLHEKKKSSKKI